MVRFIRRKYSRRKEIEAYEHSPIVTLLILTARPAPHQTKKKVRIHSPHTPLSPLLKPTKDAPFPIDTFTCPTSIVIFPISVYTFPTPTSTGLPLTVALAPTLVLVSVLLGVTVAIEDVSVSLEEVSWRRASESALAVEVTVVAVWVTEVELTVEVGEAVEVEMEEPEVYRQKVRVSVHSWVRSVREGAGQ